MSRCADGWVLATLTSREQFLRAIGESIVPALEAVGRVPPEAARHDWERWEQCREAGSLDEGQMAAAAVVVAEFFGMKTRRDLFTWAVERDIHLAPANPPRDPGRFWLFVRCRCRCLRYATRSIDKLGRDPAYATSLLSSNRFTSCARSLGEGQGEFYLPLASGLMVMSYLGRVLDRSRRAS